METLQPLELAIGYLYLMPDKKETRPADCSRIYKEGVRKG